MVCRNPQWLPWSPVRQGLTLVLAFFHDPPCDNGQMAKADDLFSRIVKRRLHRLPTGLGGNDSKHCVFGFSHALSFRKLVAHRADLAAHRSAVAPSNLKLRYIVASPLGLAFSLLREHQRR